MRMTETMSVNPETMRQTMQRISQLRSTDISQLPENCISNILSLTTPRDTCICSIVCSALRLVADSDNTWECLLPPDYRCFLSRAVETVEYASKKDLFRQLCDRHILIDDGKMSFGLEKSSGAKCFMVSARALQIAPSEHKSCWKWIRLSNSNSRFLFFLMKRGISNSRFRVAIRLRNRKVSRLEISHKMTCRVLSAHTAYAAYLIYRIDAEKHGRTWLGNTLQECTVIMHGITVSKHWVCLDPNDKARRRFTRLTLIAPGIENIGPNVRVPEDRGDGWMEIEMGTFYNYLGTEGNNNGEVVEVRLKEVRDRRRKSGLHLQGIEFRPLQDQAAAYCPPSSRLDDDLVVEYLEDPGIEGSIDNAYINYIVV